MQAARRILLASSASILLAASRLGAQCACGTPSAACVAECTTAAQSLRRTAESCRRALADQLLDGVVDAAAPTEMAGTAAALRRTDAAGSPDPQELLRELQAALRCPQCGKRIVLSPDDMHGLQTLRNALFDHAAKVAASLPPDDQIARRRLVACSLVFPFLLVADADWDGEATAALPDWLRKADWLAECERFALHAWRPLTAFHLAHARASKDAEGMTEYQRDAAARMARERDCVAQLACLRCALEQAGIRQDGHAATAVVYELAEAMAAHGHPAEAAELLQDAIGATPAPDDPGRLHMLRLTCLYKAEEYAGVAEEATLCLREDRYPRRRPQLLYLAWASSRRLDRTREADAHAADFLKSYPANPLAADMLYASAMSSLAQADYDGARTVLARLVREFPDARVSARAEKLLERLAAVHAHRTPAKLKN